jgi:hypothetical protein
MYFDEDGARFRSTGNHRGATCRRRKSSRQFGYLPLESLRRSRNTADAALVHEWLTMLTNRLSQCGQTARSNLQTPEENRRTPESGGVQKIPKRLLY